MPLGSSFKHLGRLFAGLKMLGGNFGSCLAVVVLGDLTPVTNPAGPCVLDKSVSDPLSMSRPEVYSMWISAGCGVMHDLIHQSSHAAVGPGAGHRGIESA